MGLEIIIFNSAKIRVFIVISTYSRLYKELITFLKGNILNVSYAEYKESN